MPLVVCDYIASVASGGKFVLLVPRDGGDGGVAAFSDFSRDFQHRDIVSRWERGRGATVAASGMRVAGGGWWKYENDLLILYGQSAAYGRFDPAWLRERLRPGMVRHERAIDVR